jgi:DNA-binding GntR family transcriptional regulator
MFVPELNDKDLWELYRLKASLYEMSIDLAMDIISDTDISKLASFVKEMEDCVKNCPLDLLRYQSLHKQFHDTILELTENERLIKIASNIHLQARRFSYKSLQDIDHLESSVKYHKDIIRALRSNDKTLACRFMKEHVLKALEVLLGSTLRPQVKAIKLKAV